MFFTRVGKLIAHLVFWASAVRLGTCLFIIFSTFEVESKHALANRYIGNGLEAVGPAAEKAAMYILVAVVLGILCEISSRWFLMQDRA